AKLARATADDVFVPFTIGGGIRSVEDAQAVLDAGADKVSVNSAALERPELLDELAAVFGSQCVVPAIDAKADPGVGGGLADPTRWWGVWAPRRAPFCLGTYLAGGPRPADREVVGLAREAVERGAGEILLTS